MDPSGTKVVTLDKDMTRSIYRFPKWQCNNWKCQEREGYKPADVVLGGSSPHGVVYCSLAKNIERQ